MTELFILIGLQHCWQIILRDAPYIADTNKNRALFALGAVAGARGNIGRV